MKLRLGLFFFLIGSNFSFAQNYSRDSLEIVIDSLERYKSSIGRDSSLAIFYNDMCEKCIYAGDNRAERFLKRFENIYPQLKWEAAPALWNRAFGKKMEKNGDYQQAIDSYLKAIKILENCKVDPKHLTYSYIITGFLLTNNGNTDECIKLFNKAVPLALKQKEKSNIIWIYDYFGDVAYNTAKNKSDYLKALKYYTKVSEFLPNTVVKNLKANNKEGLAKTYWRLGEKQKAKQYFDEGIELAIKNGEGFNLFSLYNQLAMFSEEEGDLEAAIVHAKDGLKAAESFGYLEFISRTNFVLYNLYKKNREFEKSLIFFEKFKELNDSLGRDELHVKYRELESKYQVELKENKIKELENRNLYLLGYFIISTFILGFGALVFFIRTNRRLKLQNKELNNKNKQIEEALLKGQTMERKRMASELHDNISNKVLGLKMRMETLETENLTDQARENYQSTIKFIDEVYSDIRLISHNLLPEELENKGLMVALENLIKKLNLMSKTNFDIQIDIPKTRYTPRLEYEVYSVVLELVNNILKHSKASNAVILVSEENKFLKILIKDNGVGFRKDSAEDSGFGIKNVKSRIESLRGTFEIINIEGTEIRVDVPTY